MTDRPAIRAIEGMPSRPEEHLTFREPRASSHQAGVVEVRERAGCGGGTGSERADLQKTLIQSGCSKSQL